MSFHQGFFDCMCQNLLSIATEAIAVTTWLPWHAITIRISLICRLLNFWVPCGDWRLHVIFRTCKWTVVLFLWYRRIYRAIGWSPACCCGIDHHRFLWFVGRDALGCAGIDGFGRAITRCRARNAIWCWWHDFTVFYSWTWQRFAHSRCNYCTTLCTVHKYIFLSQKKNRRLWLPKIEYIWKDETDVLF